MRQSGDPFASFRKLLPASSSIPVPQAGQGGVTIGHSPLASASVAWGLDNFYFSDRFFCFKCTVSPVLYKVQGTVLWSAVLLYIHPRGGGSGFLEIRLGSLSGDLDWGPILDPVLECRDYYIVLHKNRWMYRYRSILCMKAGEEYPVWREW